MGDEFHVRDEGMVKPSRVIVMKRALLTTCALVSNLFAVAFPLITKPEPIPLLTFPAFQGDR